MIDEAKFPLESLHHDKFSESSFLLIKSRVLSSMGAWALRPFLKSIRPISSFGRSNFLPSLSAYASVFSIGL